MSNNGRVCKDTSSDKKKDHAEPEAVQSERFGRIKFVGYICNLCQHVWTEQENV